MSFRSAPRPVAPLAVVTVAIASTVLFLSTIGDAQSQSNLATPPTKHTQHPSDPAASKPLPEQVAELRDKVARLEAVLVRAAPKATASTGDQGMQGMGTGGMGGMMDKMMGGARKGANGMSGMGMTDDMMGGKGTGQMMSGMDSMGDDMDMMGMMGMGSMGGGTKSLGKMKTTAALPGFPGASHLYHIGATGFFLDHPEHVTLSTQQQTRLNRVKQKALTDKSSAQRKIDEAEQDLWELTASDEPDGAKIEGQVRAIEKLRGDQRLAIIRAIGEAAKVLTDEQRQTLLGTGSADPHKQHSAPAK